MPWTKLHPKIMAALLAALAVSIVNVGNAITDVYSNEAWTQLLSAMIPVVVGYLTPSGDKP